MNRSKVIAVILFLISLGAIKETMRIFTSGESDIVANRSSLMFISPVITVLLLFFAYIMWQRGTQKK